nr:acireductone synthase [Pseudomarimonas arenosa]
MTDIEGTTSSIAFVKQVLFPYARSHIAKFIAEHGEEPDVRRWVEAASEDLNSQSDRDTVRGLIGWIDQDRKHTALKALQGLLWKHGYAAGDYRAHVYADAVESLRRWHADGHTLAVYSSGSVPAQHLFFGYSEAGDLRPLFDAWFDTEIGGKRDSDSYRRIANELQRNSAEILFLSDVVEELDAARDAGCATALLDRRSDYAEARHGEACHGHPRYERFDEINPNQP